MRRHRLYLRAATFLLGTGLALIGCSRALDPLAIESQFVEPTASDRQPNRFYPLDIGNRWTYAGRTKLVIDNGVDPPQVVYDDRSTIERTQECEAVFDGQVYLVEHTVISHPNGARGELWARYRQDSQGLFERAIANNFPTSCGGDSPLGASRPPHRGMVGGISEAKLRASCPALLDKIRAFQPVLSRTRDALRSQSLEASGDQEWTTLDYPLVAGSSWVVNPDFYAVATVEGLDHFTINSERFPAFRIRYHYDFPGVPVDPRDRGVAWYGRVGLVGISAHVESDEQEGHATFEYTEMLTSAELVRGPF